MCSKIKEKKGYKAILSGGREYASRDVSEEARDEADSYMKESRIENTEKL